MMPQNTGNNGKVILELQGTKKDFIGAWLSRLFLAVMGTVTAASVLWFGKMILAGVMYLVSTLPPMQADVNILKKDVGTLKDDFQKLREQTATKEELQAAEQRVKQEFAKELKKGKIISTTQPLPVTK